MTDNEMQSVDLLVGPLDNFDDAVAFGDALYGLEGITRLALNEFEGSRASFTFTARSLDALTESLWRMPDFAVGAVERAVDGTLQVRLGERSDDAPAIEDHELQAMAPAPEPLPPETRPSADPFARPEVQPEAPSLQPWTPEPAVAAVPAVAGFAEPPAGDVAPMPDVPSFEEAPAVQQVPAETPPTSDWSFAESPDVRTEPPTPLFPAVDANVQPEPAGDDASVEVARVIEKLASELRETAGHLSALAAGLTPAAPAQEDGSDSESWQPAAADQPSDLAWNRDLPTGHPGTTQYDVPPVMTPQELDGIAASDSWNAESAAAEQPWPTPQSEQAATETQEEEQKGWEAPRMPAVGAVAAIGGERASEFKTEAHNAQTIALATAMGRRPSQVQLMASGFASFGVANSFIAAVRQIPGVRNVAIAELDQGRLKLTLDYFGGDSLEAQLQQLRDFPHQVVKASAKEIEIQLMAA